MKRIGKSFPGGITGELPPLFTKHVRIGPPIAEGKNLLMLPPKDEK
jgi:hypothetical protein